ncbi:MAG: Nif3-like dinuclear metal center hexameric protein [Desulfuromonadales bacterium]|jgi:dinuclear metal center YbgI/SA1388 family protein
MAQQERRIQDLVGLVHSLYEPSLAEEWDNVGLQVGDPAARVERVMVSLDPCLAAVQAACAADAQALVTHHPLLFRPLRRLTPDDTLGRVLWTAVRSGLSVISAHTNLDAAVTGLNSWLAEALGVTATVPLQPAAGHYLKLAVFVPEDHQDAVAEALFSAGAGQIGAYDNCSFRSPGLGTFRPGDATNPYLGTRGKMEQVNEVRLETILPRQRLGRVLDKMHRAHPYEEVAYDLLPLENEVPGAGLGRIGRLKETVCLDDFAAQVKGALGCQQLRLTGDGQRLVRKVALCGGSGAGLLKTAHRQGADVLVTGDVKYHEARQAEELQIALIDAGHFPTEQLMIGRLAAELRARVEEANWSIDFIPYTGEQDPFRFF